ncbi:GTP-binding protein [Haploplasma axanthum]|uniref:Uncharacterized GTP-binding protein YjiA n=1 Tax=Haploplasma axanthum TaxID=29552 RepID=A0A449BDF1_HAPAX|nr:GTP-binding protein [Haploplasma axanthum]VEU80455.1 Uncharacterized GTP-binding protein YjiA [Haploplasma axanthum]
MSNKKMPVTILNGYLGAGKTTLLNNILNNQDGLKVAVIVNDLAEFNIDSKLVENGTSVTKVNDNLVELSNGCICCTLQSDLLTSLDDLINSKKYDYIIIESSGMTEPIPVAQTIYYGETKDGKLLQEKAFIDSMITVVDAYRLKTEFGLGHDLEHSEHEHHHDHDHHEDEEEQRELAGLLVEQIEFCNIIVLNKVDLVDKEDLEVIKSYIKKIQPYATIIETEYTKFDYKEIINKNLFNLQDVLNNIGWVKELSGEVHHHDHDHAAEYGITSFVYRKRIPFSADRLSKFYQELPVNIVRSKGIIWLESDNQSSYILSQAGKSLKFDIFGSWVANLPKEQQDEYLKNTPSLSTIWDKEYGDRLTELVVIGHNMDEEKVRESLDEALLTDNEFEEIWKAFKK